MQAEKDELPALPQEVDAVWCMVRGEKDLVEAQDYYYTANQMRAYAREAVAKATEGLRKDAERYRKWRYEYARADSGVEISDMLIQLGDCWTEAEVDAAIDRSLSGGEGGGNG